jgi:hypothetical protein
MIHYKYGKLRNIFLDIQNLKSNVKRSKPGSKSQRLHVLPLMWKLDI